MPYTQYERFFSSLEYQEISSNHYFTKKKRKNNNDSMLSDAFYEYVQLSGL